MKDIVIVGSLTSRYGGGTGGIATHVEQLAAELERKGCNITIYSDVERSCQVTKKIKIVGIKSKKSIVKYAFDKPLEFSRLIFKRDSLTLKEKITSNEIVSNHKVENTVLHIHSLHNTIFEDKLLEKFECVFTDHGFWQSKTKSVSEIKNRILKSKVTISVSNYAQKILTSTIPDLPKNKLKVIYNPIKVKYNKDNTCEYQKEHIFFNGYSESMTRKGFVDFCELAKENENIEFIAIADSEAGNYARLLSLKNLTMLGKCSYDEITSLYRKSKIMVLPSNSESFGLVYIEAALNGVPVIGFEPVINEFNQYFGFDIGVAYSPNDEGIELLQKKFTDLYNSDITLSRKKEQIQKRISWDTKISEFIDVYTS